MPARERAGGGKRQSVNIYGRRNYLTFRTTKIVYDGSNYQNIRMGHDP